MKAMRVLVVDDEPDFLKLIRLRLEAEKYEVLTSPDGRHALETIRREKPDAVESDAFMPQTIKMMPPTRRAREMGLFMILGSGIFLPGANGATPAKGWSAATRPWQKTVRDHPR